MKHVHLGFIFFFDLVIFLYAHFHFPQIEWIPLPGFLTSALFRCNYLQFLGLGLGVGLSIDMFCLENPFGCYTISILGAYFLLKRASNYFYEDNILSFGVFCFIVSLTISLLSIIFLNILDRKTLISSYNLASDFLFAPMLEAISRVLCLQLPLTLIIGVKKLVGRWLQKRKESQA